MSGQPNDRMTPAEVRELFESQRKEIAELRAEIQDTLEIVRHFVRIMQKHYFTPDMENQP